MSDNTSQHGHTGPHPTVIGNMLDPAVNADGAKSGHGVGGTAAPAVKAEGAEHIPGYDPQHYRDQLSEPGYGDRGSGLSSGLHSATGNNANEPGYREQHNSGIDHIRQASGLGSSNNTSSGLGSSTGTASGLTGQHHSGTGSGIDSNSGLTGQHHHSGTGSGLGSGVSLGVGSGLASEYGRDNTTGHQHGSHNSGVVGEPGSTIASGTQSSHHGLSDRSRDAVGSNSSYDNTSSTTGHQHGSHSGSGLAAGAGAAGIGAAEHEAHRHHDSTTGSSIPSTSTSTDPASNTAANARTPTDSNVRTGTDPTTSADPTTARTAQGQTSSSGRTDTADTARSGAGATGAQSGTASRDHQPTQTEAQNDSDGKGGPPPSIPTAGGERIGTKHWGESKVIPDKPVARSDGADTSSNHDDLTSANTASNTGSAHTGKEKESVVDKIKDKLHMGHK